MISYLYNLEKNMKSILTSNHGSFSIISLPNIESNKVNYDNILIAMPSLYYICAMLKSIGLTTKLFTAMPFFYYIAQC